METTIYVKPNEEGQLEAWIAYGSKSYEFSHVKVEDVHKQASEGSIASFSSLAEASKAYPEAKLHFHIRNFNSYSEIWI